MTGQEKVYRSPKFYSITFFGLKIAYINLMSLFINLNSSSRVLPKCNLG